MHSMFIATDEGAKGLEDLGLFSLRLDMKAHSNHMESFNGAFLKALDSTNASCFIDKENNHISKPGAAPGTFIYKQHGGGGGAGWGQAFFASLLSFISAVDTNRDTLVDDAEIAHAKANWPAKVDGALRNMCGNMTMSDPFQIALGCDS